MLSTATPAWPSSLPSGHSRAIAQAHELGVLALQSPQIVLGTVAGVFQHRTGHTIVQIALPNEMPVHIQRRIEAGQKFDVAFLVPAMFDQMAKDGRIDPATRIGFLRVPTGLAVEAAAPS